MPGLEVIPVSEAPSIHTRQFQYAMDLLKRIVALEQDQVLRITPDDGKSLRGRRVGIGRIIKAADIKARTWDDGMHL